MAILRLQNIEWRDDNEVSKYPFEDTATLTNGSQTIFAETFIDAIFYPIGGTSGLYLSRIEIGNDLITFVFGDNRTTDLIFGSIPLYSQTNTVELFDQYNRAAGQLISTGGRLTLFAGWPFGTHFFNRHQTGIAAFCYIPVPNTGVRGILTDNNTLVTGDVWLVGTDGIQLTLEDVKVPTSDCFGEMETVQAICVNVVGEPLFKRKVCSDGQFSTPRFIEQLILQTDTQHLVLLPDAHGNVRLIANNYDTEDTILRIASDEAGLVISTVGDSIGEL